MHSIVPIGTFEEKARDLMGDIGFEELLELIARRPKAGNTIQGTGGLRKLRAPRRGIGKRGGVRVIYYFHSEYKPILLLLVYAKADQENLTAEQKSKLKKYVDVIIEEFK